MLLRGAGPRPSIPDLHTLASHLQPWDPADMPAQDALLRPTEPLSSPETSPSVPINFPLPGPKGLGAQPEAAAGARKAVCHSTPSLPLASPSYQLPRWKTGGFGVRAWTPEAVNQGRQDLPPSFTPLLHSPLQINKLFGGKKDPHISPPFATHLSLHPHPRRSRCRARNHTLGEVSQGMEEGKKNPVISLAPPDAWGKQEQPCQERVQQCSLQPGHAPQAITTKGGN